MRFPSTRVSYHSLLHFDMYMSQISQALQMHMSLLMQREQFEKQASKLVQIPFASDLVPKASEFQPGRSYLGAQNSDQTDVSTCMSGTVSQTSAIIYKPNDMVLLSMANNAHWNVQDRVKPVAALTFDHVQGYIGVPSNIGRQVCAEEGIAESGHFCSSASPSSCVVDEEPLLKRLRVAGTYELDVLSPAEALLPWPTKLIGVRGSHSLSTGICSIQTPTTRPIPPWRRTVSTPQSEQVRCKMAYCG